MHDFIIEKTYQKKKTFITSLNTKGGRENLQQAKPICRSKLKWRMSSIISIPSKPTKCTDIKTTTKLYNISA